MLRKDHKNFDDVMRFITSKYSVEKRTKVVEWLLQSGRDSWSARGFALVERRPSGVRSLRSQLGRQRHTRRSLRAGKSVWLRTRLRQHLSY
ncbi:hypothetical protein J6590_037608 [Homalodisca vitripennis]|nr:hypothetical protein J6590_037608 [Homalodisca vitripennis]